MAKQPWYDDFERWMFRRGNIVRGVPRGKMHKSTVRLYLTLTKKAMRVMGVLGPENQVVVRSARIKPHHLIDYFQKQYPDGYDGVESLWQHDARALRKFAEWLYFEVERDGRPIWSAEDLELVKREVYGVPTHHKRPTLTKELLNRFEHEFLPWLRKNEPVLWGPTAWMFHTGLRINEVAGMNVGLKDGSVVRLPTGEIEVHGKSDSGKERYDTLEPIPQAEQVLEEWAAVRKELCQRDERFCNEILFPNQQGTRLPLQGGYNKTLRRVGKRSGLFEGDCDEIGSHATGEIALLRSHTIGRAAFVTRMSHKKVGLKARMILSRHRNVQVHMGYDRIDTASAASEAHEALNGHGNDQVEADPLDDMTKEELLALMKRIMRRLEA